MTLTWRQWRWTGAWWFSSQCIAENKRATYFLPKWQMQPATRRQLTLEARWTGQLPAVWISHSNLRQKIAKKSHVHTANLTTAHKEIWKVKLLLPAAEMTQSTFVTAAQASAPKPIYCDSSSRDIKSLRPRQELFFHCCYSQMVFIIRQPLQCHLSYLSLKLWRGMFYRCQECFIAAIPV